MPLRDPNYHLIEGPMKGLLESAEHVLESFTWVAGPLKSPLYGPYRSHKQVPGHLFNAKR